jgi:hypothetical protein
MGFFTNILEKLGLKKDKPAPVAEKSGADAKFIERPKEDFMPKGAVAGAKPAATTAKAAEPVKAAAPAAIAEVDVVKHLEELSKGKDLNWKVSIVDLLKLLDIDSSREARNELAKELACPENLMNDSAKMNVWLHKEVLRKIAANGGNIPANLLD